MLYKSDFMEKNAALQAAAQMCAAARTAPKAHGRDTVHTIVLTDDEKKSSGQKDGRGRHTRHGRKDEYMVWTRRRKYPCGTGRCANRDG